MEFDQHELPTGDEVTGSVFLHRPAPAGGAVVALTSSNPALLPVPATVTVPEGETPATFEATAERPVAEPTIVLLTATLENVAYTTEVLLLPLQVTGLTIAPSAGPSAPVTVERWSTENGD